MEINIELLKVGLSGLALVPITITVLTYRFNIKKKAEDSVFSQDKVLLDQSILSLQWAYNLLTDSGREIPPSPDRLNWLTAARHLWRYKKISSSIKSQIYKTICSEHEEYWRHSFYMALSHKALKRKEYYMNSNNSWSPVNIEVNSALIINDFSTWPEGMLDPVDEIDQQILTKSLQKGPCRTGLAGYKDMIEVVSEKLEESGSDSNLTGES